MGDLTGVDLGVVPPLAVPLFKGVLLFPLTFEGVLLIDEYPLPGRLLLLPFAFGLGEVKLIIGESVEAERKDVADEELESKDLPGEVRAAEIDWRPLGDVIEAILWRGRAGVEVMWARSSSSVGEVVLTSFEGDLTYMEVVRAVRTEPVTDGVGAVDVRRAREGGDGVTGPLPAVPMDWLLSKPEND